MKAVTLNSIVAVIRARRGYKTFLSEFIQQCEIVDAISIPDGATNGDMIKMLFPDVEVDEKSEDTVHLKDKWHNPLVFIQIPKDIWNLPYKKEVEE
jgi:hypothetical protein